MRIVPWLTVLFIVTVWPTTAEAHPLRFQTEWRRTSRKIQGQVLDFTANHGVDRRLYSPALGHKHDMYVYLPPGYNPQCQYPFMLWLHGFAQDEYSFLAEVAEVIDASIVRGQIPPMIVAAPDGSLYGHSCLITPGSFFLNTPRGGAFEDYLMHDVWNFMMHNFPIRPEREAHIIAGVSMGGGAAFSKAIEYRDRFKIVIGIMPPVNLRWQNARGRAQANFNPNNWGWKEGYNRPFQVVGRFYRIITVRERNFVNPLYGRRGRSQMVAHISSKNPIEMLDLYEVQPGELSMFIGYGRFDEFNIDAQVESFLYRAKQRGLSVHVEYRRFGRHNRRTGQSIIPDALDWLGASLRSQVNRIK